MATWRWASRGACNSLSASRVRAFEKCPRTYNRSWYRSQPPPYQITATDPKWRVVWQPSRPLRPRATVILWPRGWASRRLRRVLQRIRGQKFIVYAAHTITDSRLLDEATALVEELLGVAAGDHEESCAGLPCGFVLVCAGSSRPHVVGYVRMASAPGSISLRRLETMVRMGMLVQARQRAMHAGMWEKAIDAVLSGSPASPVSEVTAPAAAYMGSLVVAPSFQGLGLGKALACVGAAHAARIGAPGRRFGGDASALALSRKPGCRCRA